MSIDDLQAAQEFEQRRQQQQQQQRDRSERYSLSALASRPVSSGKNHHVLNALTSRPISNGKNHHVSSEHAPDHVSLA